MLQELTDFVVGTSKIEIVLRRGRVHSLRTIFCKLFANASQKHRVHKCRNRNRYIERKKPHTDIVTCYAYIIVDTLTRNLRCESK